MAYREIDPLMPMKEPAGKSKMFSTLLKVQDFLYFEHHLRKRLEAEDAEILDNNLLE
jgi:hypothetical protein